MAFITLPFTFVNGTFILAPSVNSNFTAVTSVVNGGIDNTNISSSAAIALSKLGLNPGSKAFNQTTTGQVTWASGLTTDTQARVQMVSDKGLQFGPGGSTAPDVELLRSAANTLQWLTPAGGAAILDGNAGTLQNVSTITLATGGTFNLNGGSISGTSFPMVNNGRLYLVTGLPFADSAATATLFFGPVNGNQITLYNGSAEVTQTFSQTSLAVGGLGSNTVYDIYVKSASSTTVVISTVAWAGLNTPPTRGTQDGRFTKNGDATNLLVGCIWMNGSSQLIDNTSTRGVANLYNTASKAVFAQVPVASWTYTTSTWRAVNSNSTDGQGRVSILQTGLNPTLADVTYSQTLSMAGSVSNPVNSFAIALDSTTASSSCVASVSGIGTGANFGTSAVARYSTNLTAGYHYLQMIEIALGGVAGATMYGNGANQSSSLAGAGIF